MRCLVTAGPTFEPLDRVRRLTNFSTGRLGTELANHLVRASHHVTLLRGRLATCEPPVAAVTVESFTTTTDLADRLWTRSTADPIAIFHAAAVSDFGFGTVFVRDSTGQLTPQAAGKFATDAGELLVELKPTAKILPRLRDWFPRALIVGWKYEVDGNRASVLTRGERQVTECRSDACVVNGPAYGLGFGVVRPGQVPSHCRDLSSLFIALGEVIAQPVGGKTGTG